MTVAPIISGTASAGFEPVADAFATSFGGNARMGAALCIYVDGQPVVDLWGGMADPRRRLPWSEETLNVLFSCTKGLTSILAAQLVQQGKLDYEAPVTAYWPEYGQAGKQGTKVKHLLSHRAGLSAPRECLTSSDILDWKKVVGVLERQEPLWPPGDGYAYHAITHGWLVGELIARITGESVGWEFARRIARPLGADAWIGLPRSENRRVSYLTVGDGLGSLLAEKRATQGGDDWGTRAGTLGGALPDALAGPDAGFNDPRLWEAQIPGAGGIADARSLARILSATVCETFGTRLLDAPTLGLAVKPQSEGEPVFPAPPPWPRWGMGLQLDSEARRYLTPKGFGHDGAGGQVAFAEPDLRLGFAFVTNLMEGVGDARATSIIDALRAIVVPGR